MKKTFILLSGSNYNLHIKMALLVDCLVTLNNRR